MSTDRSFRVQFNPDSLTEPDVDPFEVITTCGRGLPIAVYTTSDLALAKAKAASPDDTMLDLAQEYWDLEPEPQQFRILFSQDADPATLLTGALVGYAVRIKLTAGIKIEAEVTDMDHKFLKVRFWDPESQEYNGQRSAFPFDTIESVMIL